MLKVNTKRLRITTNHRTHQELCCIVLSKRLPYQMFVSSYRGKFIFVHYSILHNKSVETLTSFTWKPILAEIKL